MKRFVLFIVVFSFSVLIWSCSEETQSPTSTMDPGQSMAIGEEEFNAEFSDGHHNSSVEFEVTLENLNPATGTGSSQPFSPPVLAIHKSQVHLIKVHRNASDELRQIVEDAVNGQYVGQYQ